MICKNTYTQTQATTWLHKMWNNNTKRHTGNLFTVNIQSLFPNTLSKYCCHFQVATVHHLQIISAEMHTSVDNFLIPFRTWPPTFLECKHSCCQTNTCPLQRQKSGKRYSSCFKITFLVSKIKVWQWWLFTCFSLETLAIWTSCHSEERWCAVFPSCCFAWECNIIRYAHNSTKTTILKGTHSPAIPRNDQMKTKFTWMKSTKVIGSSESSWPISLENRFKTLPVKSTAQSIQGYDVSSKALFIYILINHFWTKKNKIHFTFKINILVWMYYLNVLSTICATNIGAHGKLCWMKK